MKLKKRTSQKEKEKLFTEMMLAEKSLDDIKQEVFQLRILAVFMLVLSLGSTYAALTFGISQWGSYWEQKYILAIVLSWMCFLMSVYMAVRRNSEYKILIEYIDNN